MTDALDQLGALNAIARQLERLALSMDKIEERLRSWDRVYKTQAGFELHQLSTVGTTFEGRRRDDRRDDRGYDRR